MKNTFTASRLLATIMALVMCTTLIFSLSACDNSPEAPDGTAPSTETSTSVDEYASVWSDATYTEDTILGEGEHTFYFEVIVGDHSVTFTVNTDKETVGAALMSHDILAGEDGEFGLYVKTVNGMFADYDVDASYWGFYQDGEYAITGVDQTAIEDGAHYEMVYTK